MSDTDKAPLEDLMVAMDVVDTLRHQQVIAERELDAESRRQRMLERLKKMYQAQGIEVPERVLLEGITALEEERFSYTPVSRSWRTRLAHMWVARKRWGRPIALLGVIGGMFFGVYMATDVIPNNHLKNNLPTQIQQQLKAIQDVSKIPAVVEQSKLTAVKANDALNDNKLDKAEAELKVLQDLRERLSQEYTIRVISRPEQSSGVWRIPPGNKRARNYYLIVEAIDRNNRVVELNIVNEENNKSKRKKTWGLRVDEKTFHQIASDKKDDGIIQGNKVGVKKAGYLKPDFSVPTTGATITEW